MIIGIKRFSHIEALPKRDGVRFLEYKIVRSGLSPFETGEQFDTSVTHITATRLDDVHPDLQRMFEYKLECRGFLLQRNAKDGRDVVIGPNDPWPPEYRVVDHPVNQRLDPHDTLLLACRQKARTRRGHRHVYPMMGDLVRFTCGTVVQVAHAWGMAVQMACIPHRDGSWHCHLSEGGGMGFSGGLHGNIPINFFHRAGTAHAHAWMFHNDEAKGGNGISVVVEVSLWECPLPYKSYYPELIELTPETRAADLLVRLSQEATRLRTSR